VKKGVKGPPKWASLFLIVKGLIDPKGMKPVIGPSLERPEIIGLNTLMTKRPMVNLTLLNPLPRPLPQFQC